MRRIFTFFIAIMLIIGLNACDSGQSPSVQLRPDLPAPAPSFQAENGRVSAANFLAGISTLPQADATQLPRADASMIPLAVVTNLPLADATTMPLAVATDLPIADATALPLVEATAPLLLEEQAAALIATASVDKPHPGDNANVTVTGRLLSGGEPVAGVSMHSRWHYFSTTTACDSGVTDDTGTATCTLDISRASYNYAVKIDVTFTAPDGRTANASTSFTPH